MNGKLGTVVSSARFKDKIQPMDKASESILSLQPVTFRYKHQFDPKGIRQFGLVAEEVEKVNPDLVARDEQGKPNSVRYEAVNAMLLNEFLKEHRKVEEQSSQISAQDLRWRSWKQLSNSYNQRSKRRQRKSGRSATSLGHSLQLLVWYPTIELRPKSAAEAALSGGRMWIT